MKRPFPVILLWLFLFSISAHSQELPSRLLGSPYPASPIPESLFVVADNGFTAGQRLTVVTLQGLVSKGKSGIYLNRGSGYSLWLSELEKRPGLIVARNFKNDYPGLVTYFRNHIKGYILCDLHSSSSNAAISLCGLLGGVAATADQTILFNSLGLTLLADARGKDETWVLDNYPTNFNDRIVIFQNPSKDLFLADYSVFAQAFHFYAPLKSPLLNKVFSRMESNSLLLGWGEDEFNLVKDASVRGIQVHAADWVSNLSILSRFQASLAQPKPVAPKTPRTGVHTVCFLMSDGDNLQWTLGGFASDKTWYGSPNRGRFSMGWTLPPALSELAPTALDLLYQMAKTTSGAREHFVAAPSGMGYMFPEALPSATLAGAASLTAAFMAKADMHLLNILGNDKSPKYFIPFLIQKQIDAIFYYPFSNYSELAGDIFWVEGKPVIGGYANLWEGFETPASLAAKLNARPKDPTSKAGYSLIPVHAWSNGVDSINACAAALGQNVQVVAPDEFVKLIMANLGNNLPNSLISVGEISSAKKGPSQGQGFTGVHFEHRDAQGRAILGKLAPK